MPQIGLGAVTFGREISEEESYRILDYAVERGITLVDTAEAYGKDHASERTLGRWMRAAGTRSKITLVTKVTTNHTRAHVREAIAGSLERLQTDKVDIYLFHSYDADTPQTESTDALEEVVRAGLAGQGGCSNYSAEQLAASLAIKPVMRVIQNNYNLVAREIEDDLLPLAKQHGIHVLTYSPLAAGFLMGKYTPDRTTFPKGTRFDVIPGHADVYFSDRNFRWVENLHALAARLGMKPERLAMAWVFANKAVDTVLVGARTTAHIDNAIEASRTELSEQTLAEISAWS